MHFLVISKSNSGLNDFSILRRLVPCFLGLVIFLTGCAGQLTGQALTQAGSEAALSASDRSESAQAASPMSQVDRDRPSQNEFADLPRLDGKAKVKMVVNGKTIKIAIDGTKAPITAGNFVDLVQRGVYNGLSFHRVVREPRPFVVQGGDPQSKDANVPPQNLGTGSFIDPATGKPRYIPLEILPEGESQPIYNQPFSQIGLQQAPILKHRRGAVAMARSPMPFSASSQFYFALTDLEFLDGDYAVFGYVEDGMAAVDGIQQGDRIESAQVLEGLENLKTSQP